MRDSINEVLDQDNKPTTAYCDHCDEPNRKSSMALIDGDIGCSMCCYDMGISKEDFLLGIKALND